MKNLKKVMVMGMAAVLCTASMAGCGNTNIGGADAPTDITVSDTYKIGVLQYADHPSLDNCREGFVQGLDSEGITYELNTQSAKGNDATNTQVAQQFVSQKLDLLCGIATPSAQACYNAAYEAKIPVIFNAVSDPVAANLAKSTTEAMDGITGVSDMLPVDEQLKLIREMLPDAKKVGVLYTTSEANSISTIKQYASKVSEYGFELVEKGVTNESELPQAIDLLLTEVDCISNMTDNTVVNNLPILLEKSVAKNIPVFGSEEEQVGNGCLASAGIDYIELGKKAGVMAARVLKGEDIASIPYETLTESKVTINTNTANTLGVTIPQSITDRAEVKNTPSAQ